VARYVLRYRGPGPRPDADVECIVALPGVEIIDESSRLLLVDGPASALRGALASLPGWVMSRERSVPLPEVRRRPRGQA